MTPASAHAVRDTRHALHRLVAISIVSLALYLVTCLLERALFYNGTALHALQFERAYEDRASLASQMTCYVVLTVLVFATYLLILRMCKRGELDGGLARFLALAVPVFLNIFCLMWRPWLSQDVYSYLAHGFLGLIPGHNPLLQPVETARDTAIGPRLAAFGWLSPGVSPYGILWTRVEMAVARYWGGNLDAAVLSFKAIATIASLCSARLIWVILGRISPTSQLQGTLAYLWNPLIIMEFAGEGHNDALMIFFSLAAVGGCIAYRPTTSMIMQLLGVMSKYICLLFLPAQICYLWRVRRNGAQLALQLATAVAVSAAMAIVLYAPLWAGLRTFDGIIERGDSVGGSATLFGATAWLLKHSPLKSIALPMTCALLAGPMLAWIAWSAVRVNNTATLARTCAWISLAFVLVASPDYWPWYACMPVAWIVVGEPNRLLWLALLMSALARLVAPLEVLEVHGHLLPQVSKGLMTGLGTLVPLAALCVWLWQQWRREHRARKSAPAADAAIADELPIPGTRGGSTPPALPLTQVHDDYSVQLDDR